MNVVQKLALKEALKKLEGTEIEKTAERIQCDLKRIIILP